MTIMLVLESPYMKANFEFAHKGIIQPYPRGLRVRVHDYTIYR